MTTADRSQNPYTAFPAALVERTQLSPHFTRLTFAGDALRAFGGTRLDQRMKLVLADDRQRAAALAAPDWLTWWREQPAEDRPQIRTYTVRAVDQAAGRVVVDFVTHGTSSPASRFALTAALGQEVILVGPDARVPGHDTSGVAYRPGAAEQIVLIGDETAVPAIANACEQRDGSPARLRAFIEVPTSADILDLDCRADDVITWLPRLAESGAPTAARGEQLCAAVAAWAAAHSAAGAEAGAGPDAAAGDARMATPASGTGETEPDSGEALLWEEAEAAGALYTWVAADAPTVKQVRRILLNDHSFDKRQCSFMGYWKPGVSGN
ncbi:siderophore-interacting protein [Brevibacterium luteolum]|uniref:Siderophore-interacting protein n=1 Tax=Brevibacterium luteolum TaxID=199591 RepID=A0A849ASQ0_9MICO|nr:siderophore-interacting protein [Brevibacterium luteolum]MBM7530246.1 NADPH-dependent ferric siderophore reductase [Brevibacterium luteolum]MCT1828859.1 siderophore-interacting protein [Brevibacterium luteolum]NNG79887.1 siderophore-interacting protein [Brevibacterium luteolum]